MEKMDKNVFFDFFSHNSRWQVFGSGLAKGTESQSANGDGKCFRYDFCNELGFVAYRCERPILMPQAFCLKFDVLGSPTENKIEFKLVGKGGQNVWRAVLPGPKSKLSKKRFTITELQLPFAWGPAGGGSPGEIEAVEFVVVAGNGGAGFFEIYPLDFVDEFPTPEANFQTTPGCKIYVANLFQAQTPPLQLEGQTFLPTKTNENLPSWLVPPATPKAELEINFNKWVRFGGIVLSWLPNMVPSQITIESRDQNEPWKTFYSIKGNLPSHQTIYLPRKSCEAIKLIVHPQQGKACGLLSIHFLPQVLDSANEFLHSAAQLAPRGSFTRYWLREQTYWTPVARPSGAVRALLEENGSVEPIEASPLLEPFIFNGENWTGWSGCQIIPRLPPSGAPLPTVLRKTKEWKLSTHVDFLIYNQEEFLRITWKIELSKIHESLGFAILIRPWQLVPPWQSFRRMGGFSAIRRIQRLGNTLELGTIRVIFSPQPHKLGGLEWHTSQGFLNCDISQLDLQQSCQDLSGFLSGIAYWQVEHSAEFFALIPLPQKNIIQHHPNNKQQNGNFFKQWRSAFRSIPSPSKKLPKQSPQRDVLRCSRTCIGHILACRNGIALQPGPRRYTRLWTRDATVMGAALARANHTTPLLNLVLFLAKHVRLDGHVPAVFDTDKPDPIVEHDSHGQFLWAAREALLFGAKRHLIQEIWPAVERTAEYITQIRETESTPIFSGLLPASVSHEGYLSQPVHSFWDDFWAARGLLAAAELANAFQKVKLSERWNEAASELLHSTITAIYTLKRDKNLDFLPASIEWADFDPTSLACAVALLDFSDQIGAEAAKSTFRKYLLGLQQRQNPHTWKNATAYEIRIVSALARLGLWQEAQEVLLWMLDRRLPIAWNQWPEITWNNPRTPAHIGDLPHAWIAAEFFLAIRSLYLQERENKHIIIGHGIPPKWIEEGVCLKNCPTRFGKISLSYQKIDKKIHFTIKTPASFRAKEIRFQPNLQEGESLFSKAKEVEISPDGKSCKILQKEWKGEFLIC